jgi:hypothetical protein
MNHGIYMAKWEKSMHFCWSFAVRIHHLLCFLQDTYQNAFKTADTPPEETQHSLAFPLEQNYFVYNIPCLTALEQYLTYVHF